MAPEITYSQARDAARLLKTTNYTIISVDEFGMPTGETSTLSDSVQRRIDLDSLVTRKRTMKLPKVRGHIVRKFDHANHRASFDALNAEERRQIKRNVKARLIRKSSNTK